MGNKNKQKPQAQKEVVKAVEPAAEENLFDEPESSQEEVSLDSTEASEEEGTELSDVQGPGADASDDSEPVGPAAEEPKKELRQVGVHPVSLEPVYR